MKVLAALLVIMLAFSSKAIPYPKDHLKECILGVKQSPIVLGVPERSIENFCDCALTSIIDEGKDDRASGMECAAKSFN